MEKYPASLIQEQFWLTSKLHPDNPAYNLPLLYDICGALNIDALKSAMYEILRRHEIFRTTFSMAGNRLFQIISDELQLPFDVVKQKNQINEEIIKPFDLASGPLLRTTVFDHGNQEYTLLIVMHHIVTDLRGAEIFCRELSELYRSFVSGAPHSLGTPLQQKDFTQWHHKFIQSDKSRSMLKYWKKSLAGHTGYLNLPTDTPRPPVLKLSGNAVPFHLTEEQTTLLLDFCKANKTDIFLFLLTTCYILLFRYTDQKDIIMGVPLTNRRENEHKNISGSFVNILPIAARVSGEQTFSQLLQQVRMSMLGAHRNQEVPYSLILKKTLTKREVSFNPLFQTGFTFEPPVDLDLEGLTVTPRRVHNTGTQLDLFFTLWIKDNKTHGFIEFNSELFAKDTIRRISGNYKTLIKEIIAAPEQEINSLNILTKEEKQLQLNQWNQTEAPLPDPPVLPRSFELQAKKTPDSIAFICNGLELTYKGLNTKANQLAHYLQTFDIGPGSIVGVFMDRSLNMAVSLYAILKAGAAYVPLDPAFPRERIAYMLENTTLTLVLTEEATAPLLPGTDATTIFVDTIDEKIKDLPTSPPRPDVSPENLAYVIYTSGSTGNPKGVQVPHRAVVNFLHSMSRTPGITPKDILLSVTTLSFDISVLELFLPQITGATTVIATQRAAANGEELLELLLECGATAIQATPVTFYLLLAAGWKGSDNLKVMCGGEPVPLEMARELNKRASSVWNMYGPTETTVWSTCCRIKENADQILVGKPIENTQTYIVNKSNQPNPIGVAGELLIGGTGVTHGYLKRPDLTDKVFIPNVFDKRPDANKLYRTGDMASFLPDGTIKVLGRIDNQIKLRGYRIELGEIDSVLETHPSIKRAAAVVREDEPGNKHLAAYVTLESGYEYSETELRQHLRTKLPEYMIPSTFVLMADMPMTLNGKIDRKSLPEPEQKHDFIQENLIPPTTQTEKELSALWEQVLNTNGVSTQANFFEVGGNSLLSVKITALIKEKMGISIPIAKFYQYPTITSLSTYITQLKEDPVSKENQLKKQKTLLKDSVEKKKLAQQRMKLKRRNSDKRR